MKIIDLHGKEIEVTNLQIAIAQAEQFKDYKHDPPVPELDKTMQAYWTDIYQKLKNIQNSKY